MKKRIGTRNYDTEKSELICEVDGGQLYRKRSSEKEWFAVFGDVIRPLNENNARDKELIKIGMKYIDISEPERTTIWVDRETHKKVSDVAKEWGCSLGEVIKRLIDQIRMLCL